MYKKLNSFLIFLVFIFGMSASLISQELSDGLVGYWPMDEGEENTTVDLTGNGNDGTIFGDANWVDGKFGSALEFDGIDDYVDIGNDNMLELGSDDFTISAWINTTVNSDDQTIFGKGGDNGGGIRYHLAIVGQSVKVILDDDVLKYDPSSNVIVADSTWHNIICTRAGNALRLYIDGEEDMSFTGHAESTLEDNYDFSPTYHGGNIGAIMNNTDTTIFKFFKGLIDDVAMWNRALDMDEIIDIYTEEPILEEEGGDPINLVESARGASGVANVENYPNPFQSTTTFKYELLERSHTYLTIFNSLGQKVVVLVDEMQSAGSYEVTFDGSALPEGIYFAEFQTASLAKVLKILLTK